MGRKMTATKQPHLNNIVLFILILLMLAMLALQVYHIIDSSRPILRPAPRAPERDNPLRYKFMHPEAKAPQDLTRCKALMI
jgi:hypothetical protein